MKGLRAKARGGCCPRAEERDEAVAAMAGDPDARFKAPPPFAIAHTLLAHWLNDRDRAS